jgi:hypothetical protein
MRPARLPRLVLWLTALAFVGFGVAFAVWPVAMARLTDIALPTPTAMAEYVATYGGFQTGFGIFLVVCALRPAWLEPGLWAGALALGGFGTFRLLSLLLGDGPVGAPIYVGLSIELGGALLNVLALRSAAARG